MSKELTNLYRQRRGIQTKVTNNNKSKLINKLNKIAQSYGFGKLSKKATLSDVRNTKNMYSERMGYDILTLSIQEGNVLTTEIVAKELKNTKDIDTKKLVDYGTKLARAKQRQNSYLTKKEVSFMDRGNLEIKGFGELDIITLLEKAKNKKEINQLVNEIYTSNPKEQYYNGMTESFKRVFQKVELTREGDLEEVIKELEKRKMEDLTDKTNYLLQTLEIYGSPDNMVGEWDGDETSIANARLDDMMVRLGLKKNLNKDSRKVISKATKITAKNKGSID